MIQCRCGRELVWIITLAESAAIARTVKSQLGDVRQWHLGLRRQARGGARDWYRKTSPMPWQAGR